MEQQNLMFDFRPQRRVLTSILIAGLYLRLSKEDVKFGYSVSIETQEAILRAYCEKNGITIHDVYIDDGLSGGNYNRPDFIRMKQDMDDGVLNCVITKDLSRLGRDHIMTDYLTEIYFPAMGIRYIAVDDNVDTQLRPDNEMIPIKNLFNDWHLRDTSKKVKNAKRQRMKMGLFVHSQAPYGYMKDPNDKNRLIIDPEAASVVRLIQNLMMQGLGVVKICRELETQKILKPAAYKALKGDKRFARYLKDPSKNYKWQPATVQKILKDITYLGCLDNHRTEVINYKTKQRVTIPQNEHIVVENTQEALLEQDNYDIIQHLMRSRHRAQKHDYENIFKRIVFCAHCGGRMHIARKEKKSGEEILTYRCLKYYHYPDKCMKGNHVNYNVVYRLVESELRKMIALFQDDEKCIDLLKEKFSATAQVSRLKVRLQEKISRRTEIQKLIRQLYEDHVKKILDTKNYQGLLLSYQQELEDIDNDILSLQNEMKRYEASEGNIELFKNKIKEFAGFEKLTANMVNQLIERIEISHKQIIDGEEVTPIKIVFRYIGSY